MINEILYWLQLIAAICLLVIVVVNDTKGSGLGSLSGGSSSSGNGGYVDFMTKITGFLLLAFFFLSFFVSYADKNSVVEIEKQEVASYMDIGKGDNSNE